MNIRILLLAGVFAIAGCSTTAVPLGYQPAPGVSLQQGQAIVQVGKFVDARKVDPYHLGAIRGGLGNALKTLVAQAPVADVFRDGFSQALAARGMLRNGSDGPYVLAATALKFDCNQFVRREAHAEILVTLTETGSGRTVMTDTFRTDLVRNPNDLFDAGVFASTEDLRLLAMEALHDVIDAALDSPKLKLALADGTKPS